MKNKQIELRDFDLAELLDTEEKMIDYLNAELADGDPHYIKVALKAIARARNMSEVVKKSGIPRTTFYRALSSDSNTGYFTIQKILNALDLHLKVVSNSDVGN
ncbi:MAG: putative addiction module antidote protein [Candidatus Cloacimonetes bacterium]|nr:putative addiction module antidote protein [Candidatus Cloacimonadota bacterium]